MFWMISDRSLPAGQPNASPAGFGKARGSLTYWTSAAGPATDPAAWTPVTEDQFKQQLVATASRFPLIPRNGNYESQKHVTFFIHGYNENWAAEAALYQSICDNFFSDPNSLGECVLFDWPSDGEVIDYLPDRAHARACAEDLADVLSALYDWMLSQQQAATQNPANACRAKTSVLAHSMGNYLFEKAMAVVWTRKNQPLLMSLINQLLMIAADVDNDLFDSGETVTKSDGDAIANLTYRVTALYSGLDPVLGLSAGLKHFGKRRLGRSGLDTTLPLPDNVWDIDCSAFFQADKALIPKYPEGIHSAYFTDPQCQKLIRALLAGVDRTVLVSGGQAPLPLTKPQL
jgi:esterase/lipase superfamily enzyme